MNIEKLPVDFKDDIINPEFGERRKYNMIHNADGTISFEDVTEYLQRGSIFGSKEVVDANKTINSIIEKSKFYGIMKYSLDGAIVTEYSVSENNVQLSGFGYAWGNAIPSGEMILQSGGFRINVRPNTAYRLKLDFGNYSFGDYEFCGIINSYVTSRNGARIKFLSAQMEGNPPGIVYLIIYNHDEYEISSFNPVSYIEFEALVKSHYDLF